MQFINCRTVLGNQLLGKQDFDDRQTRKGEMMTTTIEFIDRNGCKRSVDVVDDPRVAGYKSISTQIGDLRGPIVKLWTDGHLGVRHTAVTVHNAALVVKGKSRRIYQGIGIGARVAYRVGKGNPQPRLHVRPEQFSDAITIVSGLSPD